MYQFQPDDGGNKCEDEEQAPKRYGLLENQYAYNYRSDSSDSCPYGVGRSERYGTGGLGEQNHTEKAQNGKTRIPKKSFVATFKITFSQTKGKTGFAKTCQNQNNPVHH